ncbi:MAG TPA: tRNA dihydrouridine synthase DusB [Ilumatobacter sp.]|nr:tRNA dihydrouridine synthase DusB [Ilumatobacter sp.]
MIPLRIGDFTPAAPVVLAPMAGVTNTAFRTMCRSYGPDLVYVNEMVMATAVVHRNPKTEQMMAFGPDESPRSLQLYGSDPDMLGRAVRSVCDEGRVDHIDLNFGCPAAKVTRKGGGAAVPAKPRLLRAIVRAAVQAAAPYGVPVTAKFRMGLWDDLRTDITTGQVCADEGVGWIALHARTVEQHYSGEARWRAIGELKAAVPDIPVLGNGDIWEASDAVEMMRQTDCDGVVIGRGCLGRPWLFGDLVTVLNGGTAPAPRRLDEVVAAMSRHARLLVAHYQEHGDVVRRAIAQGHLKRPGRKVDAESSAMRDFRKHTAWYMSGYPVGSQVRRDLAMIGSLAQLDELLGGLDGTAHIVEGGERFKRGHTNGPIKVSLPDGYLDDRDSLAVPDDNDVMALSGG